MSFLSFYSLLLIYRSRHSQVRNQNSGLFSKNRGSSPDNFEIWGIKTSQVRGLQEPYIFFKIFNDFL